MDQIKHAYLSHDSFLQNIDRNNITHKNNALFCYQWRLPRYKPSDIDLLFAGFIRTKLSKLFMTIPSDIIYICIVYFNDHDDIINAIKNCENRASITSGAFGYKSCKFYLELSPRGKAAWDADMQLHLVWISKPKDIKAVYFECSGGFMERLISINNKQLSTQWIEDRTLILSAKIKHEDIQHLDTFTFNFLYTKSQREVIGMRLYLTMSPAMQSQNEQKEEGTDADTGIIAPAAVQYH